MAHELGREDHLKNCHLGGTEESFKLPRSPPELLSTPTPRPFTLTDPGMSGGAGKQGEEALLLLE